MQDVTGLADHANERDAQPWRSQLRHHLIPSRGEAPVRFTARAVAPQLMPYWDNDWAPPAAGAGAAP
jgi:hypothetical protein